MMVINLKSRQCSFARADKVMSGRADVGSWPFASVRCDADRRIQCTVRNLRPDQSCHVAGRDGRSPRRKATHS